MTAMLVAACGGKANAGDGAGSVRAIAADQSTITLEHGDIPGLMKAMTMEYAVAKPELLGGVAVGDTVEFHLVHAEGAYSVTALRETPP